MDLPIPEIQFALPSIIARIARHEADRIAVEIGPDRISYGTVATHIDRMASWLVRHGMEPSDTVGILSDPIYPSRIATLAALKLGLTSVSWPHASIAPTGATVGVRFVLGSAPNSRPVFRTSTKFMPLSEDILLKGEAIAQIEKPVFPQRLFLTSGSTGEPKAILLDAEQCAARTLAYRKRFQIDGDSRVFAPLGLSTNPGFFAILAAWSCGATVILPSGPKSTDAMYVAHRATHIIASPRSARAFCGALPSNYSPSLQPKVFVGGGRMSLSERDQLQTRLGARVFVNYGSTECGATCTADAKLLDSRPGAVGYPIDGATIEIVDESHSVLPNGVEGNVRVRTPSMAVGYHKDSTATEKYFRDGWFYPGDVGTIDRDGCLVISGRADDTLNIGGNKVRPDTLERKIEQTPGVAEAFVTNLDTIHGDATIAVAIVSQPDAVWREIAAQVLRHLSRFGRVEILEIAEIPRNAMGKILRKQAREIVLHKIAGKHYKPGRTPSGSST